MQSWFLTHFISLAQPIDPMPGLHTVEETDAFVKKMLQVNKLNPVYRMLNQLQVFASCPFFPHSHLLIEPFPPFLARTRRKPFVSRDF